MQAEKKLTQAWESYTTLILQMLFGAVLIGRFLFPFFFNPIDRVYSDMQRHVDNGINLLHPGFLNGVDPKIYQVWMYMLHAFPESEYRSFCALFSGLLCAGMAWFWYKALREMTSRRKALCISIILGLHFSLLVIYAFFMIETMLLTVVPLAVWMTLRAIRKHTLTAFIAASLCWIIAVLTKPTILPIAFLGMGYALAFQPRKMRAFGVFCVLCIVAIIPAGLQSMKAINVFAPFGQVDMQVIGRKSERTTFGLRVYDGQRYSNFQWWPESFLYNIFFPVATYTSPRSASVYTAYLDLTLGQAAWDAAIEKVEKDHSWHDVLNDYKENALYLFFVYSWPDATPMGSTNFWVRWNYELRWLWFPCFMAVLFYGPFARMTPHKTWILLSTFITTWIFLLQDTSIIEGRYRKAIEPFLLVSVFFMLESLVIAEDKGSMSMRDFIRQIYAIPAIRQLLSPIFPSYEHPQLRPATYPQHHAHHAPAPAEKSHASGWFGRMINWMFRSKRHHQ